MDGLISLALYVHNAYDIHKESQLFTLTINLYTPEQIKHYALDVITISFGHDTTGIQTMFLARMHHILYYQ